MFGEPIDPRLQRVHLYFISTMSARKTVLDEACRRR
jgi:hypothetical protein